MKLDTLINITNNLCHDEDVNGIVVRLKWEDIECNMVLDCRDLAFDEDDVEFAINYVITNILIKIKKAAEERFSDQNYIIGPGIKYVRISTNSYLDTRIMEVRATLEGRLK